MRIRDTVELREKHFKDPISPFIVYTFDMLCADLSNYDIHKLFYLLEVMMMEALKSRQSRRLAVR
jgi:hypothetical protein